MIKRIATFLVLAIAGQAAYAQANDDVQILQSIYGKEKRDVVTLMMNLNDADGAKFWPIYDAYEVERKKLGAERLAIIDEYAKNYSSLTDAKADELMARIFKNDLSVDKLHKSYYAKVKKAISPMKAAQFFQIEVYLQNQIRAAISDSLPFIGEFN
jgi:hypothetical protein